jgi:hypothetical protein
MKNQQCNKKKKFVPVSKHTSPNDGVVHGTLASVFNVMIFVSFDTRLPKPMTKMSLIESRYKCGTLHINDCMHDHRNSTAGNLESKQQDKL